MPMKLLRLSLCIVLSTCVAGAATALRDLSLSGALNRLKSGATWTIEGTLVIGPGGTLTVDPAATVNGLGGGGGGSGTVTAVSSGNISGLATVSIANSTSTPAFTFSLASTTQNYVWAGPTSGSGAGDYRLLVAGDIPQIPRSKISDAGDAAGKNTGTTAGTVAAGDDSRITGAASAAGLVAVNSGGVNSGGKVDWSQLMNVPAGFADGSDDGTGGGSGTVTAVSSGNISGLATVSVANSTSTPAFTFSLASTTQNYVWAGPASGSGVGDYRRLVAGDIPQIPISKLSDAGDAAGKNTGTGSSNVAAGDHSHSNATTSAAGYMSAADKTKLDGVASGATANDTDGNLKNRANHTGQQAMATISDAGNAATRNVGTTSGTVAAGDDSRIVGAAQKSANGSDFANVATVRANIGLDNLTDHGNAGSALAISAATGNHKLTLNSASCALTVTSWSTVRAIVLTIIQDGTGSRVIDWSGVTSNAPTISTAAASETIVTLYTIDGGTTVRALSNAQTDVSDTAYSSAANGATTTAFSKNSIYDQLHIGDTDDDGKPDVIDNVSSAGFLPVSSGGVPVNGRTLTGTSNRVTVTNGTGAGGDPVFDVGTDVVTKTTNIQRLSLTLDTVADGLSYTITRLPAAFTVTKITGNHEGSGLSSPSIVATFKHGTNRTSGTTIEALTVTSSTTGTEDDGTLSDGTIPANSFVWVELSSKSGTTAHMFVEIWGTYD